MKSSGLRDCGLRHGRLATAQPASIVSVYANPSKEKKDRNMPSTQPKAPKTQPKQANTNARQTGSRQPKEAAANAQQTASRQLKQAQTRPADNQGRMNDQIRKALDVVSN